MRLASSYDESCRNCVPVPPRARSSTSSERSSIAPGRNRPWEGGSSWRRLREGLRYLMTPSMPISPWKERFTGRSLIDTGCKDSGVRDSWTGRPSHVKRKSRYRPHSPSDVRCHFMLNISHWALMDVAIIANSDSGSWDKRLQIYIDLRTHTALDQTMIPLRSRLPFPFKHPDKRQNSKNKTCELWNDRTDHRAMPKGGSSLHPADQ